MSTIAFLVSHLSGTGHLVRTLAIARAAASRGCRAVVISGGRPLAHVDPGFAQIVQLPWIGVRGRDFTSPLDAHGRPVTEALYDERARLAAGAVAATAPDVLVLETWPLGRRRLRREYVAAVDAARSRPGRRSKIAISVRDLPEPPSKPARLEEAVSHLASTADAVLVHGEESFLPLGRTWPLPDALAARVRYTGYVSAGRTGPDGGRGNPMTQTGEIVVGVGGGDTGRRLLQLTARAAAHSEHSWRLRTGGSDAEALASTLTREHSAAARHDLTVEPPTDDWQRRLASAAATVTLAGYNTVTDLAPLSAPGLLIPDELGGQREQALRAAALARFQGIETAEVATLDPAGLAVKADALAAAPRRPPLPIALDGAERSADLLAAMAGG
ncbi:MAG: glycosyltransferase [Pseudomonadota bacterium]